MPPKPTVPNRERRGASVGLADLAVVGFIGGELAIGGADECGLLSDFAYCQYSGANAENIRLAAFNLKAF